MNSISLPIRSYRPSLQAGTLNCIQCPLTLVCLCVRVHWRTLIMSSSLLLLQCLPFLVHLTWIVCQLGAKWPYDSCFVGCCFQDWFKTAQSILVSFPSNFFSMRFVRVHVVQTYNSTDTASTWKKSYFIRRIRWKPANNCQCFLDVYVDIVFSRWDIATEVYELVFLFQRLALKSGDRSFMYKKHELLFYLGSSRGQCFQLFPLRSSTGIWFGQVYLW